MIKKILLLVIVITATIGTFIVLDLHTFELVFEDPGHYVVARRSDHPRQVINAIDQLNSKNLTHRQLKRLNNRYKRKLHSNKLSEADRKLWKKAHHRIETFLNHRTY